MFYYHLGKCYCTKWFLYKLLYFFSSYCISQANLSRLWYKLISWVFYNFKSSIPNGSVSLFKKNCLCTLRQVLPSTLSPSSFLEYVLTVEYVKTIEHLKLIDQTELIKHLVILEYSEKSISKLLGKPKIPRYCDCSVSEDYQNLATLVHFKPIKRFKTVKHIKSFKLLWTIRLSRNLKPLYILRLWNITRLLSTSRLLSISKPLSFFRPLYNSKSPSTLK